MIKFFFNGMKVDGKLYKADYYMNNNGSIMMTAVRYEGFPKVEGLTVTNDSKIEEDFTALDRVDIFPMSEYFEAVKAAFCKQQERREARAKKVR